MSGVWGGAKYRFMTKMEIKINLYAGEAKFWLILTKWLIFGLNETLIG